MQRNANDDLVHVRIALVTICDIGFKGCPIPGLS